MVFVHDIFKGLQLPVTPGMLDLWSSYMLYSYAIHWVIRFKIIGVFTVAKIPVFTLGVADLNWDTSTSS